MKQPRPYLLNVLSSIDAIRNYKPDNEAAFLKNAMSQDAILMRLQDVGENLIHVRDIFPEFWEANATEAWNKVIGLRIIISHAYGEISLPNYLGLNHRRPGASEAIDSTNTALA